MNGKTSTIINAIFGLIIMGLISGSWQNNITQFERVDRNVEALEMQYGTLGAVEVRLQSLESQTSQILTTLLSLQPVFATKGSNLSQGDYFIANNTAVYVEMGDVPTCRNLRGRSMEPLLFEGGWACTVPVDIADLTQHDLFLYQYPPTDQHVLHPVYGVYEDEEGMWVLAWGYNNSEPDWFKIRQEHIIGKAVLIWRR